MADTQLAGTGWAGQFWLDNATGTLTELVQVVGFTLPQDQVDQVEITHLKSTNRRREFAPGLIDGGEFQVTLNYRAGSDTDKLLAAAVQDTTGATRSFKAVIPERGVATWDVTGESIVTGYDRGEVTAEDKMEATVTLKISGALTEATHT